MIILAKLEMEKAVLSDENLSDVSIFVWLDINKTVDCAYQTLTLTDSQESFSIRR